MRRDGLSDIGLEVSARRNHVVRRVRPHEYNHDHHFENDPSVHGQNLVY